MSEHTLNGGGLVSGRSARVVHGERSAQLVRHVRHVRHARLEQYGQLRLDGLVPSAQHSYWIRNKENREYVGQPEIMFMFTVAAILTSVSC